MVFYSLVLFQSAKFRDKYFLSDDGVLIGNLLYENKVSTYHIIVYHQRGVTNHLVYLEVLFPLIKFTVGIALTAICYGFDQGNFGLYGHLIELAPYCISPVMGFIKVQSIISQFELQFYLWPVENKGIMTGDAACHWSFVLDII